jgi:uncharacterized phiE125 gp8 family phage protein
VTLEDDLLTALIGAATEHLDGWTGILGRCLVEQTWRQDYDAFASCLRLPLGPVISISAVEYTDTDGEAQAVDPSAYSLKTDAGGRSRIEFTVGTSFIAPIGITYKAGYVTVPEVPSDGETPAVPEHTTVPMPIRQAILLFVGAWYENREETAIGVSVAALPESVDTRALLAPYRRVGV